MIVSKISEYIVSVSHGLVGSVCCQDLCEESIASYVQHKENL